MKTLFTSVLILLYSLTFAQINTNSLWTWVNGDNTGNNLGVYGTQGVAAATNKPGGRYGSISWTDASGNFWLFGGSGNASSGSAGNLNDLWKYNPTSNIWTWVNGDNTVNNSGVYGTQGTPAATNKPGGRYTSISWTDASGNFWLFGGLNSSGIFNDLWKYDPTSNNWTWVNGDNSVNSIGIYGTQGIPATTNKPGARYSSVSWKDASGNFWFLGGRG